MSIMKKMLAALATIVVAMSMSAVAFADEANTITAPATPEGHTYTYYQVFTGDLHEGVLSNIVWGNGVSKDGQTAMGAAATLAKNLENAADAEALAAQLTAGKYLTNGTDLVAGATSDALAAGYYLVVDKAGSQTDKYDVYTQYIMKVVGQVSFEAKRSVPSVEKEQSVDGMTYTKDGLDVNINDPVYYQITGTLPANLDKYNKYYKYIFTDTMSEGLTYNNDMKVYAVNGTTKTDVTDSFTIKAKKTDGKTVITAECADVTKIEGVTATTKFVAEYSAVLNDKAVIGNPGNDNTAKLTFSNNPNQDSDGDEDTGDTPEQKTTVFTYELDVTKVDGANAETKLPDAEFKLQNAAGKWAVVTDGKISGWADAEADGSTLKSDKAGLFAIAGLDAGKYYLKETKAPAGYNLIADPIELTIAAEIGKTAEGDATVTKLDITTGGKTADGDVDAGTVDLTVANNKGNVLPETGGMGTTLLYAVGAILVLGAGVLLVVRRRMKY